MARSLSPFVPARTLVEDLIEGGYYREAVALWGSLTFGRVLELAALHPGNPLTIVEFLWRSRASLDSVQRAVRRLVDASVLVAGLRQRRAATYVLPSTHPALGSLKELALRTVAVGPRLRLARDDLGVGSIREAFAFGSTARGTDRDDSDLDVGIVGLIDLRDLVRHQEWLNEETGRVVNFHVFDPEAWSHAPERQDFLGRVFAGSRIPILP